MSETLGEKLRKAREERGISISEVAEQTRISPLYLKSIEQDDYKPLPGGIFNKGFVRSYARYIGFDENEALQDYSRLMAESATPTESDQTLHHSEVWTDDRSARSMGPTVIFAVVILALLAGGIVLLVRYLSGPSSPSMTANITGSTPSNTASVNVQNNINAQPTNIPTAAAFNVELKADGERVWVGYTLDGNKTEKTLDPGESLPLNVQDSLRLSYAKVKAQNLQLSINGKRINVLGGGPKGNFDLDINKNNYGQILQTGELGVAPATASRPAASVSPRPSPKPSVSPVATPAASPKPPAPKPNANVGKRPPQ